MNITVILFLLKLLQFWIQVPMKDQRAMLDAVQQEVLLYVYTQITYIMYCKAEM